MAFQKMRRTGVWLIGRERSSLVVAFLMAVLGIKAAGCENLQVTYPRGSITLKIGDLLNLTCTVTYQGPSKAEIYWCKWAENQSDCTRVHKELERLQLNPQGAVNLLEIHNVSHSHSGRYQCSAKEGNQTAMGHYISVTVTVEELNHVSSLNATGSSGVVSQNSEGLRMDSWLEKMQILIMILWLIFS